MFILTFRGTNSRQIPQKQVTKKMFRSIPRAVIAVVGVHQFTNSRVAFADGNGKSQKSSRVVIIGGGTGGTGVAAMLKNDGVKDISIIEPSSTHYYQPLWTLVGGGLRKGSDSARPMKDMIRDNARWIQDKVVTLRPDSNEVVLSNGDIVKYDYLVVAAGTGER